MMIWRAVQASILVVNMGMLAGFGRALKGQGRLGDMGAWRGEEWGNYCYYGWGGGGERGVFDGGFRWRRWLWVGKERLSGWGFSEIDIKIVGDDIRGKVDLFDSRIS